MALYKNVLSLESPDLFKDAGEDAINIDTVFQNIKETYDKKLLKIIYNTLLILDEDTTTEDIKPNYIDGLLKIVDVKSDDGERYQIVHNIGGGQVMEDTLFSYHKIIGHYRLF